MKKDRKYRTGHALAEYVLPTILLTSSVLGTLASPGFQSALQNYYNAAFSGSMQGNTLIVHPYGILPPGAKPASSNTQTAAANNPNSTPGTAQSPSSGDICLSSGLCIAPPSVNNPVDMAETIGALGGGLAQSSSDVIQEVAAQLQAQGADPSLIDLITKLAIEGHNLGDKIDSLGNYAIQNKNTMNGSTRSVQTDSAYNFKPPALGDVGTAIVTMNTSAFTDAKQKLSEYFAAHPGSYADVSALIDLQVGDILNISNGVTVKINETGSILNTTAQNTSSGQVHQDANTICSTGGSTICKQ